MLPQCWAGANELTKELSDVLHSILALFPKVNSFVVSPRKRQNVERRGGSGRWTLQPLSTMWRYPIVAVTSRIVAVVGVVPSFRKDCLRI